MNIRLLLLPDELIPRSCEAPDLKETQFRPVEFSGMGNQQFVRKDLCLNQVGSMIKTSPGKKIPFSCVFFFKCRT